MNRCDKKFKIPKEILTAAFGLFQKSDLGGNNFIIYIAPVNKPNRNTKNKFHPKQFKSK